MTTLLAVVPGATIVVVTLLSVLPWGITLSDDLRALLPMMPYLAIHYWTLRRPALVPEWLVFLSGFATDVVTNGPLGYWAFVYLVGYAIAVTTSSLAASSAMARWLQLGMTLAVLALVQWLVACIYFGRWTGWQPVAVAAAAALLCYPFLAYLLSRLGTLWTDRDNAQLARGV